MEIHVEIQMRMTYWWLLDLDKEEFCGNYLSVKHAARVAGLRHSVPENVVFESFNKKWLIFPGHKKPKSCSRVAVKLSEMWKFKYDN